MNNLEMENEQKRKVAVALKIWNDQCAAATVIKRLYEEPAEGLEIIRSENYSHFVNTIERAKSLNVTEEFFGLTPEHFKEIITLCRSFDRSIRISPAIRLAIFMKYVREGRSEALLARDIGVSQSSVSRIIQEMIFDLTAVADQFIKFPSSLDELIALEKGFTSKMDSFGRSRNLPCFGCLDGKHWATKHPQNSGSLNANYKGFFSYNSLVVCDADLRIMYLQVSDLGTANDASLMIHGKLSLLIDRVVRNCGFRLLDDGKTVMPPFLASDNGFKLTKSVMQPYRQAQLTADNIRFNKKFCSVRVRIENLFGSLVSKFQVFDRSLKLAPNNSKALIVALSVIHNIQLGPLFSQRDDSDDMIPVLADPYNSAEEMREALKRYILNN